MGLLEGGGLMGGLRGALEGLADPQGLRRQQALQNYIALEQLKMAQKAAEEKPQIQKLNVGGDERLVQINPYGRGASFINPTGMPQPQPGTPPIPPGADPKTFRVKTAEQAVENTAMGQGGQRILTMVDQLEKKVGSVDPETGKFVGTKEFTSSTGPFISALHDQPIWSPGRIGYEIGQSRENKTYLDTIKQDAQAINSTMERELLKGGGQITVQEREQIRQILGAIQGARSPEDAKKLLDNFRGIVRSMFKMDQTGQPGQPAAGSAQTATPDIKAARRASDGNYYVPDPARPGKYLRVKP